MATRADTQVLTESATQGPDAVTALGMLARAFCLLVGSVVLGIAVWQAIDVYGVFSRYVREPKDLKPKSDSLAEAIQAERLTWSLELPAELQRALRKVDALPIPVPAEAPRPGASKDGDEKTTDAPAANSDEQPAPALAPVAPSPDPIEAAAAAAERGPMAFGHALAMLLYFVLLGLWATLPLSLLYAGGWVMTRAFAYDARRK